MNETDSNIFDETTRSAHLLSPILLICIAINSLLIVFTLLFSPEYILIHSTIWMLSISLLVFICMFFLNHRGFFRIAVSATLAFISFMIFHFSVKIGSSSNYYCHVLYLIVPILLSSLLLSVRKTFIIIVVMLSALPVAHFLIPETLRIQYAADHFAFLAITSTFILYIAYNRKKQEMIRVRELMNKEKHLQQILQEKDVLIKEVHHRVKNNLQVIISLLNLQSYHFKNKQILKFIQDSKHRILSIAEVHENLYQSSNLSKIEFSQYIHSVTRGLMNAYNRSDTANPAV